jgi:hypothetical protein
VMKFLLLRRLGFSDSRHFPDYQMQGKFKRDAICDPV